MEKYTCFGEAKYDYGIDMDSSFLEYGDVNSVENYWNYVSDVGMPLYFHGEVEYSVPGIRFNPDGCEADAPEQPYREVSEWDSHPVDRIDGPFFCVGGRFVRVTDGTIFPESGRPVFLVDGVPMFVCGSSCELKMWDGDAAMPPFEQILYQMFHPLDIFIRTIIQSNFRRSAHYYDPNEESDDEDHLEFDDVDVFLEAGIRGLSMDKIDAISSVADAADVVDTFVCVICQTENVDGNVRKLNCGHVFDAECVEAWLQSNSRCPICRKDFQGD